MSASYRAVNWNRQKRIYDGVTGAGSVVFLAVFVGLSLGRPDATLETALIRGLGALAFTLLHVILCIGPLARLDSRFLPLLYNRRHLGVTMAVVASAHAAFALLQYHGGGLVNPVVSLFQGAPTVAYPAEFPFEWLGLGALIILAGMAVTSHDFWLSALGPPAWKRLHMLVYVAYGLLVMHVALGILQGEPTTGGDLVMAAGVGVVVGLHLAAGLREWRRDARVAAEVGAGWVDICAADDVPDGRARAAAIGGERVAVYRYGDRVSCVSAVCRHQNGPLAEGRIIDGCITCPWHGYQYYPDSGASPPPFQDKIATYRVRVRDGRVEVHQTPNPPGTPVPPASIR